MVINYLLNGSEWDDPPSKLISGGVLWGGLVD